MADPVILAPTFADSFPWSVGEIERSIDRATRPTTHGGAAITAREAASIESDFTVRGYMEIEARERLATGKAIEEVAVTPEMMRSVVARAYSNKNAAPRELATQSTFDDLRDVKVSLEKGAAALHNSENMDALTDVTKLVDCMANGTEKRVSAEELKQMLRGVDLVLIQVMRYRGDPAGQTWFDELHKTRAQLLTMLGGNVSVSSKS
jgi:hypothetical protein